MSCRQAVEQGLSCQAGYMVDGAKSAVDQEGLFCRCALHGEPHRAQQPRPDEALPSPTWP